MIAYSYPLIIPFILFIICSITRDPNGDLIDPHLIRGEDIISHIKNGGTGVPANEFFSEGPEGGFGESDGDNIPSTPTADFHMAYEFLRDARNNGAFPEELQKMTAFENAEKRGWKDRIIVTTGSVFEAIIEKLIDGKSGKTHIYINRFAFYFGGIGLFAIDVASVLAGTPTTAEGVLLLLAKDVFVNLGKVFLFLFSFCFIKAGLS